MKNAFAYKGGIDHRKGGNGTVKFLLFLIGAGKETALWDAKKYGLAVEKTKYPEFTWAKPDTAQQPLESLNFSFGTSSDIKPAEPAKPIMTPDIYMPQHVPDWQKRLGEPMPYYRWETDFTTAKLYISVNSGIETESFSLFFLLSPPEKGHIIEVTCPPISFVNDWRPAQFVFRCTGRFLKTNEVQMLLPPDSLSMRMHRQQTLPDKEELNHFIFVNRREEIKPERHFDKRRALRIKTM